MTDSGGGSSTQSVWLLYDVGSWSGTGLHPTDVLWGRAHGLDIGNDYPKVGHFLATLSDTDGDGCEDLLVGAPNSDQAQVLWSFP